MKVKKAFLTVLLGSSVMLAACGGEDAAEKQAEDAAAEKKETANADQEKKTTVSAGEKVYQQSCLSCHGGSLEGGFGPPLDTIGSKYSEEEILQVIQNGQKQMPPNIVAGEDAQAVAEWLATQK